MRIATEFDCGTTAYSDTQEEADRTIALFAEHGMGVVRSYAYDDSDPLDFGVIYTDNRDGRVRRDVTTFTLYGAQEKAKQIRRIREFSGVRVVHEAEAARYPSCVD